MKMYSLKFRMYLKLEIGEKRVEFRYFTNQKG